MPANHNAAILPEDRIARLFGDPGGERSERRHDGHAPGTHVILRAGANARSAEVRARLDHELERAITEPVAAITTIVGVLKHQVNEAQAEQLATLSDAAERTGAMLRDLLSFVRFGTGGARTIRRRIDLKVLCERVVDAIHSAHPDRPMLLTTDRRIEGEWDPDAIETLLSKLVLNAIEHGAPRPAIRIGVRGLPGGAALEVWNAGALSDHVRDTLFEPFVRAPATSSAPRPSGLGLGLYIVREIARSHGGSVQVRSDDAQGTTFLVTLPRS